MTLPQTPRPASRARLMGGIAFALSGVLIVLYETVAPRADETTLEGAEAWASGAWAFAHIAAIIALIHIPLGYGALRGLLEGTRNEKTAFLAATIGYIGSALTISYYGAEVYGLNAIGERALADGDASLTEVGADFRLDPTAITVFAIGLALIAIAAVLASVAVWRSGLLHKWSGVPFAVAMVLYLPHFYLPPAGRIAWGALVAVSALWIAAEFRRSGANAPAGEAASAPEAQVASA